MDALGHKADRTGWLGQWVYAHRGMHGPGVPENSPSAFTAAIACGLGIECDVQRSADGQAMVFHDWELDRLTSQAGPICAHPAAELSEMSFKGGTDCIPTLAAVLAQVDRRVPLLIEVKSRRTLPVGAFCASITRDLLAYGGSHAVMSFDPRVPYWFSRHAPHIPRGLVVTEEGHRGWGGAIRRRLAFRAAKSEFLAYDIRDLPSPFASALRARGVPVLSWTVRTPELAARAKLHADAPIAEAEGLV